MCELAAQLHKRQVALQLEWVPRDANVIADQLTNEQFTGFSHQLRVRLDLHSLPWICLHSLLDAGADIAAHTATATESVKDRQQLTRPKRRQLLPGWNA